MSEQSKPPSTPELPRVMSGNKAGYTCAICGAKVPDLAAEGAAPTAAAEKALGMHRYRPFCSARCQRIDLGNWLDERYIVPGPPVPSEGGDDPDAKD